MGAMKRTLLTFGVRTSKDSQFMLLVHLEDPTPRARHVASHVIGRLLGIPMSFSATTEEFRSAGGPKLSYGRTVFEGAYQMPFSAGLAFDAEPEGIVTVNGVPHLFAVDGRPDLFASVFRLLSLVDELTCSDRDRHGRVPATSLFVVKHGLSDVPWVDHWAARLGVELNERWPGIAEARRSYRNIVTVDLDNVLRHAGRPLTRALGATARDLLKGEPGVALDRWRVRMGERDPYLNALDLVEEHLGSVDEAILFLLVRGDSDHDHAVPPDRWPEDVRSRFRRLPARMRMGLHPSYRSSEEEQRWRAEAEILDGIHLPRTASRQHFLRWSSSAMFRTVQALGYREEHTLGFSDRVGFRASTCTPFPWYDLDRERATDLMIHPFAAMDSSLIEQLHHSPKDVVNAMNTLSDKVRAVGGTFISVWHDRYLSGYREFGPWPGVFEQVMEHAKA